jgi:isoprenylcysteine carboxyl methyltransferase (ICMT) family protein YpbQ
MAEAEANGNIARVNNTSILNFNLDICYRYIEKPNSFINVVIKITSFSLYIELYRILWMA